MNIFIGSSSEEKSINAAKKLAKKIEASEHKAILWTDYFNPSEITIVKLIDLCHIVDGGIFVLAPDDEIISSPNHFITRDNVLIEAGILLGELGLSQVALYIFPNVKIPSDFSGITHIEASDKEYNIESELSKWVNGILEKKLNSKKTTNIVLSQRHLDRLEFEALIASAKKEIMMSSFLCLFFRCLKNWKMQF